VATIEGCDPDTIAADMPVVVRFGEADDGQRLPAFVPDPGAGA
jgi:hypothetical protein